MERSSQDLRPTVTGRPNDNPRNTLLCDGTVVDIPERMTLSCKAFGLGAPLTVTITRRMYKAHKHYFRGIMVVDAQEIYYRVDEWVRTAHKYTDLVVFRALHHSSGDCVEWVRFATRVTAWYALRKALYGAKPKQSSSRVTRYVDSLETLDQSMAKELTSGDPSDTKWQSRARAVALIDAAHSSS